MKIRSESIGRLHDIPQVQTPPSTRRRSLRMPRLPTLLLRNNRIQLMLRGSATSCRLLRIRPTTHPENQAGRHWDGPRSCSAVAKRHSRTLGEENMKREIFCRPCGLRLGAVTQRQVSELDAAMSAQEKIVKVYGVLTCSAMCDFCGAGLNPKDAACCQSIVPIGGHYYEWETEYLEKATTQ